MHPARTITKSLFLPLVFGLSFVFYYLFMPPLFLDADTPWHIATGDLIRQLGYVPTQDSWSYTAPGAFWLNYSWLWDVLISYIHSGFGADGLFVFAVLWLSGLVTLVAFMLLRRAEVTQDPVIITLALVAMVLMPSVGARPQMFSYLAALLVHWMLHANRTSDRPNRILWQLPLMMVLWVNMHSGFIFGFILLGVYGLECILQKDYPRLKRLVITGVGCIAAIHITPLSPVLGLEYLPAIYHSLSSPITQFISEWQPYRFTSFQGFDAFILVLLLASNFRATSIPAADRMITALWLLASLSSIRNFAMLGIVAAPMLALSLEKCLLHKAEHNPLLRPRFAVLGWVGVMAIILVLTLTPVRQLISKQDRVLAAEITPKYALDFLREHYPTTQFYNSWILGGFIIYYAQDIYKVASDGRATTVYPPDAIQKMIEFFGSADVSAYADEHAINAFFLHNKESRTAILQLEKAEGWKLVYRDQVASVFLRNELATSVGRIMTEEEIKAANMHMTVEEMRTLEAQMKEKN